MPKPVCVWCIVLVFLLCYAIVIWLCISTPLSTDITRTPHNQHLPRVQVVDVEDQEHMEESEQYERKYNFRYEEPGAMQVRHITSTPRPLRTLSAPCLPRLSRFLSCLVFLNTN